ncbi:NAD(P)-dependent oxidoreductase [Novosphingobium rosa]|uniref:NAD(P)-dependent oxidoreductase n=1 Tax=Novosphingobium rosa TaxID=76978 RepID=UPI000830EC3A|nr:NAD(P)-dependent oxidoreductase [Novosphingobium rosa]
MKVALIGAGGNAGQRILSELVARGHHVTALARTPGKVPVHEGVAVHQLDASDADAVTAAVAGHDAVISAVKFKEADLPGMVGAILAAGVTRFLTVGGAGSLFVTPGVREMDGPGFPEFVKPEARAGSDFLDFLRTTQGLDWTFISPSRIFEPGVRSGTYRIGQEDLLFDASGKSWISMEDYAVAMADELEQGRHLRARFTVGQ